MAGSDKLVGAESRAQRHGLSEGKPQLSLVFEFREALEGVSRALAEGAAKYGRGDWEKGMPLTEVMDSLGRHLVAYASGEEIDEASGLPHVDKLLSNALMLSEYYHRRQKSK